MKILFILLIGLFLIGIVSALSTSIAVDKGLIDKQIKVPNLTYKEITVKDKVYVCIYSNSKFLNKTIQRKEGCSTTNTKDKETAKKILVIKYLNRNVAKVSTSKDKVAPIISTGDITFTNKAGVKL